jgi:hypothetical protein
MRECSVEWKSYISLTRVVLQWYGLYCYEIVAASTLSTQIVCGFNAQGLFSLFSTLNYSAGGAEGGTQSTQVSEIRQ